MENRIAVPLEDLATDLKSMLFLKVVPQTCDILGDGTVLVANTFLGVRATPRAGAAPCVISYFLNDNCFSKDVLSTHGCHVSRWCCFKQVCLVCSSFNPCYFM